MRRLHVAQQSPQLALEGLNRWAGAGTTHTGLPLYKTGCVA